jgi:hypothetical protein
MLIAAIFLGSACGDDSTGVTSVGHGTETSTGTATDGPVTLTTSVSLDDTGRTESSVTDPDTTVGTDPDTDSDTTTGPTTDTDTDSASASVTDTDAETDTDTGEEPALPGQTVSQLVTSGTQSASANYSAVFTIGQPSKLQSTHDSANYRLQGGLVGANGSPP